MKLLQLTKENIYQGKLILVNKNYPLRQEEEKAAGNLISVTHEYPSVMMESHAGAMLAQLIKACQGEKEIIPVSGYRSHREQQSIFDTSMTENGKAFTLQFVALPGCSEHQTGLAVDVAKKQEDIHWICPDFPYSGICRRFREKAANFGFVQRYQDGKEHITGISPEPWHFRYVGYPHSKIMEEKKFSLEEYIDFLMGFPYGENPLFFEENGARIQISCLRLGDRPGITCPAPEGLWQISGNNVNGVIITVWRQAA